MLIGTLVLAIILINLIILIITQNIPSVTKHQMALKIFSSTLVPVPTLISYQYSLNYPFKKKVKIHVSYDAMLHVETTKSLLV